jgi:hypothetical protein
MTTKRLFVLLAVCAVPLALSACFDEEEKVLDIVLTGETSADFSQNETTAQWTEPAVIDIAQELRDILEDNGYATSDLADAKLTSVSYGVTAFDQSHDWTIGGSITVTYNGNTQTILDYASQSIQGALGEKISAPLEAGGVSLVNDALADFRAGQNPVLTFTINNGSTTPVPTVEDPMIFDWRAWLAIQVIIEEDVKVFDPF